jgi:hypothetical protein
VGGILGLKGGAPGGGGVGWGGGGGGGGGDGLTLVEYIGIIGAGFDYSVLKGYIEVKEDCVQ